MISMRRSAVWGLAVAGVLALALTLRLWGVGFGLPYMYHFDEPTYVSAALNLGAGITGRQPNPTGFSNVLFAEYAAYFIIGRVVGPFASAADFERAYRSDPTTFLLLGRLTSALLGAFNVLVVFRLGKELGHRLLGLLAAVFLAVAFLHVRDSHYAVPDVAMGCFVSLSVLLCVLAVKRPGWWYVCLAAAAGGFAIAVKWTAWPLLVTLTLAILYGQRAQAEPARPGRFSRTVLASLLFFAGGFAVGGFQLFLKPMVYLDYALRESQAGEAGGFGVWQVDSVAGWVFYFKVLSYGLGIALLALAVLGCVRRLVLAVRSRDRISLLLLSFPVCYYVIMGSTRHYFARYALPLAPFAAVFAAEAIMTLAKLETKWAGVGKGLATLLAAVAIVQPLAWGVQHDLLLSRVDTRTWAKSWIEANLAEGSKIAVDWPVHGPPLSTATQPTPLSKKLYEVMLITGTGLSDHSADWYREQGFDYVIASSFIYDLSLVHKEQDLQRRAFYASLPNKFELVQEFRPYVGNSEPPFIFDEIYGPAVSLWQRDRPGPTIKIYKIDK